ncbi:MAG: hypothetical protein KH354_00850 [Clostridiales bacterium]|nr:hypothetical protein [Clostridiales bacterium]
MYFSPNSVNASLLNANGTPRQLYRWESKNGKRTNFSEGVYLTASKALAERAGGKAAPAYVKLENPYTVYGTAFSKADYAEIGAWAGVQVSAKNVTEALQTLGYDGVVARSAAGSHPILAAVAFDTVQTKSSENVGTFNHADADVRYELRNTDDGKTDKQSKNLLDEENLRSYNKRGRRSTKQDVSSITMKSYYHHAWATNELTGVLDADEIGMFNAAVGNIKNGTGRGYRTLSNDLYLVDVGTYFQGERQVLIVTDADYEAPSIECVYRIDFEQAKNVSLVKEEIYDAELVQREILGATFTYDRVASEESAYHRYTRESAFSFQEFDEQRRERSAGEGDRGYYRSGQGRSGYPGEAGSAGETNESRVASSSFDSAQTNSSKDADTFNRSDADVRYELRESEQKVVLGVWELQKIHTDNYKDAQKKFDSITATKLDKATHAELGNEIRNIYYDSMNASSVEKVRNGKGLFTQEEIQSIYDMAKEHVRKYINDLEQYRLDPNNAEFFAELDERLKELKSKSQMDFAQEIGEQGKLMKEIGKQQKREITEYERLKLTDEVKKNWKAFSKADRNALRFLDRLCQSSGIRMEVGFENEKSKILNEGGRYNPLDRKIYIYLKESSVLTESKNLSEELNSAILSTAAHEITHWIQDSNSELYELLHDYVIQSYIQQNGMEQYERRLQLFKKEYDKDNPERNVRDAEEEFVAYACEMMLKNTKAFETLARYNRTLAQKIADGLQNFIAKLKEVLVTINNFIFDSKEFLRKGSDGVKAKNDVSQLFEDSVANLEYMQKLWDGAFMEAVGNKTQFDAEGVLELAVNEWKEKFPNKEMSIREEEMLNRGVVKTLFNLLSGTVPISGKLMQVENVFSGEYDTSMRFGSQIKEGGYSEKKDRNGRAIEFELGTTKYTKYYDYGGGDLERAREDLKTFFRCEVPVKMDDGDHIAEVIVGFPAEKDGKNGKVNYEREVNKIIEEAMRTGKPVIDSTADRIFDDMVFYDVIKVRKAK